MLTSSASPLPYRNISPAKKIRNIKRLLSFQFKKMPTKHVSLSISPQEASSFFPPKIQSNLVVYIPSSINIPPNLKKMSNLNIIKSQSISIPPRPVYHPAIINACQRFFVKHPSELRQDEVEKFKQYRKDKAQIGEPLESEEIYLPSGGLRTCLNCRELT